MRADVPWFVPSDVSWKLATQLEGFYGGGGAMERNGTGCCYLGPPGILGASRKPKSSGPSSPRVPFQLSPGRTRVDDVARAAGLHPSPGGITIDRWWRRANGRRSGVGMGGRDLDPEVLFFNSPPCPREGPDLKARCAAPPACFVQPGSPIGGKGGAPGRRGLGSRDAHWMGGTGGRFGS